MPLYELTFERKDLSRCRIEGEHQWSIPPLHCATCGSTWKSTGEAYPTVDVGGLAQEYPGEEMRPLGNSEYERVRQRLRPLVPADAVLNPGTDFGPFIGKARGRFYDFAWHQTWTMFMTTEAVAALDAEGVRLPPMQKPTLLPAPGTRLPELLEPEAVPLIDLAPESLERPDSKPCSTCGRQASGFRDFLVSAATRIPDGVDLCRARSNTALYIVNDQFVAALEKLELTGFRVNRLQTTP